jgi:outer membrane protein OmpA-like peptidoglycan-associated protein
MSADPKAIGVMAVGVLVPAVMQVMWLGDAEESLKAAPDAAGEVAIASAAEDEYCTPALKKILRRVAGACGLLEGGGRGCQPADAKSVAALSGSDFNALFKPLSHRVSIIQFDHDNTELDDGAMTSVEQSWSDQKGASFFFVVSRASPDGDATYNQQLSQKRAESVLAHLETKFQDPDLKKEVGLMWLGEEFAQLGDEFCGWKRSREGDCNSTEINRSAFVAWIDCAI